MGKKVTVGYRYYMGLHFGLCYGPVDALLEIRAGDRAAWQGSQTASGAISINAPDLFGGEEREGGVQGTLDVMMGEATQTANAYLSSVQSGSQPGYRGLLTAVFRRGLIGCMNPYIKPWAFRVRRIAQGWRTPVWYPAKAEIVLGTIRAMNPAHIVYQCLTDPEWGMGYPTSAIDAASFQAAADALYAEGFGLCMQWARQDTVESFVQLVCNHVGGVLRTHRVTGLFEFKLIRADYAPANLPLLDDGNVIAVESFERAGYGDATNELTVRYRDPTTGKDASVTVHNLASVAAQGGTVSATRNYPGLPTAALASRVALRDLRATSAQLARVRMRVNRSAYQVLPGDAIRLAWPKLGIAQIVLRVGRVDYGTLTDGAITIDAVEDVFGLPGATYLVQQPPGWTAPPTAPQASAAVRMMESTYRDVLLATSAADRAAFPAQPCFVQGMAKRPAGTALTCEFQTRVGTAAFAAREQEAFTPHGTLASAISRTATSITLAGATDLSLLTAGEVALIDDEIVRVDAIDTATATLTIARGCLDTVPAPHAAGAAVWGFGVAVGQDPTIYANGETVDGRFVTIATGGRLADGSAPTANVTTARRYERPYPPADLQLNGQRYPASISGALTVSWKHRDRIVQDTTVLDTLAASVGPEAGVTYTLELYDQAGTLRRTYTGLTGTSQTWDTESTDSGLTPPTLNSQVRVRLWAVRGGLASLQVHDYTVARV